MSLGWHSKRSFSCCMQCTDCTPASFCAMMVAALLNVWYSGGPSCHGRFELKCPQGQKFRPGIATFRRSSADVQPCTDCYVVVLNFVVRCRVAGHTLHANPGSHRCRVAGHTRHANPGSDRCRVAGHTRHANPGSHHCRVAGHSACALSRRAYDCIRDQTTNTFLFGQTSNFAP